VGEFGGDLAAFTQSPDVVGRHTQFFGSLAGPQIFGHSENLHRLAIIRRFIVE
jgi:hypothetical protein